MLIKCGRQSHRQDDYRRHAFPKNHLPEMEEGYPDGCIDQHGREENVEEQVCGCDPKPQRQGVAPPPRVDGEGNSLSCAPCSQRDAIEMFVCAERDHTGFTVDSPWL